MFTDFMEAYVNDQKNKNKYCGNIKIGAVKRELAWEIDYKQ